MAFRLLPWRRAGDCIKSLYEYSTVFLDREPTACLAPLLPTHLLPSPKTNSLHQIILDGSKTSTTIPSSGCVPILGFRTHIHSLDTSFQDLGITLSLNNHAEEKVNSLLSFAYDVGDVHLGELFLAERKFRRDMVALELQKHAIRDARSRVSKDYSILAEVKGVLSKNGFVDLVKQNVQRHEAPGAPDQPPTNLAYFYGSRQGKPCLANPPCKSSFTQYQ
jgi:hypothetical protein